MRIWTSWRTHSGRTCVDVYPGSNIRVEFGRGDRWRRDHSSRSGARVSMRSRGWQASIGGDGSRRRFSYDSSNSMVGSQAVTVMSMRTVCAILSSSSVSPFPGANDFRFGYVNARRQRAAILRHLGFRRASDQDGEDLRAWLADRCGGSAGTVDEQIAWSSRKGLTYDRCKHLSRFAKSPWSG